MPRGRGAAKEVEAILGAARARGQRTLSEHDGKRVLAAYGIPAAREALVGGPAEAARAARRIGYPVVLKACAADAIHKTEKGLVALGLADERALAAAFAEIAARAGEGHDGGFLVQEMIDGARELMIGMIRDSQFGPSVMFGLGGIFAEILDDAAFRVAPVGKRDALDMLRSIRGSRILGPVRGMEPVDLELLSASVRALGRIGLDHDDIAEIDVNPLIVQGGRPIAADALVVLAAPSP